MKKHFTYIIFFTVMLLLFSCDDAWLDVKRNKQTIIPQTLDDLSLLLTDELIMTADYISLMQISADEYYVTDARYNTLTALERNAYIWKDDIYEQQATITDWDNSYNQVLTANVILDRLTRIQKTSLNADQWNTVRGSALYIRAKAFFNLAQMFCKPYMAQSAARDPGIPLRLEPDLNIKTVRASVAETYDRILADLKESVSLLPGLPAFKTEASKAGSFGLLARCYLNMRNYEAARIHADSSLNYQNVLIDYNTLNVNTTFPFARFNAETVQFGHINPLFGTYIFTNRNFVLPELYNAYQEDDIRKKVFFHHLGDGNYSFKGTYDGSVTPFSGIATNELYLIRAECLARDGNTAGAMTTLNELLSKRYKAGTFTARVASTPDEALRTVLIERRKELLGRGLRWSDLRRLNQEPEFASTLTRTINGVTYTLPPGDPRYVFAIPEYVIRTTGIQQNSR